MLLAKTSFFKNLLYFK